METFTLRCQIGKNDKTTLCRQLCYINISTILGQIGQNYKNTVGQLGYFNISKRCSQIEQNDKNTLCRQLGYIDIKTLRG